MRVLVLTSEYIPVWGGIGTYVYEIVRNLPKECDILVVAPKRDVVLKLNEDNHANSNASNVQVQYISNAKGTFIYNLKFQIACKRHLKRLVDEFKPDIIHTQSSMPDIFINPRKIKTPIVTTIHTTVSEQIHVLKKFGVRFKDMGKSEKMTMLLAPILKAMERRYYQRRDMIITVSHNYATLLNQNKMGKFRKIEVVHNGVDTNLYYPSVSQYSMNHFPKLASIKTPKVLYLSRLVGIKGIQLMIDSMKKVNENSKVHFIIGGTGNIDLSNITDRSNVTVLGYVPQKEKPYLYGAADIFVLPSYHENCPLSVLEAMASGMAVIATDVGGVSEIIKNGENGLLIRNSSEELADAIIKLSNDEKLRIKLGTAARITVENFFTWKKAAQETHEIYQQVISQ